MESMKVAVATLLFSTSLAAIVYRPDYPEVDPSEYDDDQYHYSPPRYSFGYKVKDDYSLNDFGHEESREGDYTTGVYYVGLPDGRFQTVSYVAGRNGYVADVSYSGEPTYDGRSPSEEYFPSDEYFPSPYSSPAYDP